MWLVTGCNSNISHAKATRELGYSPRSLYESLKDTVKWFLDKKKINQGE